MVLLRYGPLFGLKKNPPLLLWRNRTTLTSSREGNMSEWVRTQLPISKNWKVAQSTVADWTQSLSTSRPAIQDTRCQEGIRRVVMARALDRKKASLRPEDGRLLGSEDGKSELETARSWRYDGLYYETRDRWVPCIWYHICVKVSTFYGA